MRVRCHMTNTVITCIIIIIIIRPPDILVAGLRFCMYLLLLLFSFAHYPRRSLNGTQPKPAIC